MYHSTAFTSNAAFLSLLQSNQPDHPQADLLSSFFHELLAEIAELGKFSYNIREMPGAKYGGAVGDTKPEGTLIGEVYSNVREYERISLSLSYILIHILLDDDGGDGHQLQRVIIEQRPESER